MHVIRERQLYPAKTHFDRKMAEATRISRLWHPRPKTTEQVRGNPIFGKRIEGLLAYGYSFDEIKEWFRLGRFNVRAATNTKNANAIWEDIKAVYDYRCAYCGKKTSRLTKDHVIPVSKDGKDSMDNIVPACFSCNRKKNARGLLNWPQFRKLQLHLLGFN